MLTPADVFSEPGRWWNVSTRTSHQTWSTGRGATIEGEVPRVTCPLLVETYRRPRPAWMRAGCRAILASETCLKRGDVLWEPPDFLGLGQARRVPAPGRASSWWGRCPRTGGAVALRAVPTGQLTVPKCQSPSPCLSLGDSSEQGSWLEKNF